MAGGIVEQDARGRTIEILVLARVQRPQKRGEAKEPEKQGGGDQIKQGGHRSLSLAPRRKRSALRITNSEDEDIATAAISGVASPATASGTAITL
jgi:hypothetical protein